MARRSETEVLVVGAGPVGLLAALLLAERGIGVQIVDKERRTAAHSYALVLHPRSLRLLDRLGLARDLVAHGRTLERVAFCEGETPKAEIRYDALGGDFPFALILPQSALESAIEERLETFKVKVGWNHRLEEIEQQGAKAVAQVAKLDRVATGYPIARMEWVVTETTVTRASLVVGADGFHSLVRRKIGIEHPSLGDALTFAVFEFSTASAVPKGARIVLDPDSTDVYWPLEERRCRWSFEVDPGTATPLAEDALADLLRTHAPWFPSPAGEVHWSSVVQFDRRLVERFGRGNVWLAGDAAHLTGPVGAQSMNVGLAEAEEIARRAEEILRKGAAPESMEAYNSGRLEEWRMLLGIGREIAALPGADPWVVRNAPRFLSSIPASGKDLEVLLRQLGLESRAGQNE